MKIFRVKWQPLALIGLELLALISLIVLVFQKNFYSVDSDLTYHIASAQSFVREGGVTAWENWDSLPLGRPHLYPPAIHVLISPLLMLPIAPMTAIGIFNGVSLIGIIGLSWLFVAKLFGWRTGAIYLFVLASSVAAVKIIGSTIPASFVLLLSPALIILIKNRKYAAATILLALFMYAHMVFPWVVAAALMVWACAGRRHLKQTFRIILAATLMYMPWLVYICSHLEYLRYFGPSYRAVVQTTILYSLDITIVILYLLFFALIAYRFAKRRGHINPDIVYFMAMPILTLPIAYFEFSRYAYSVGLWPMMVVVAFGLSAYVVPFLQRQQIWARAGIAFLVPLALCFNAYVETSNGKPVFRIKPDLFIAALATHSFSYLGQNFSSHFNSANILIADQIMKMTPPGSIILSYSPRLDTEVYQPHRLYILPQLFAALTDRPMANLRSPEYNWQEGIRPEQAGIILLSLRAPVPPELQRLGSRRFSVLARSTDGFLVLRNDHPAPLSLPPARIVMPLWLAWAIMAAALAYIATALVPILRRDS